MSEDVENLKSFLKIRILAITTQITLSSSALHFEKFRKVGKFDKNALVFLFAKLVQISTVFKEEIQKAPIDSMLHMHLPVTQSFKTA